MYFNFLLGLNVLVSLDIFNNESSDIVPFLPDLKKHKVNVPVLSNSVGFSLIDFIIWVKTQKAQLHPKIHRF